MIILTEKQPFPITQERSGGRNDSLSNEGSGASWLSKSARLRTSNLDSREGDHTDVDLPPQYETINPDGRYTVGSFSPSVLSPDSTVSAPLTAVQSTHAVNYVSINQPLRSIECAYTIDPSIDVPVPLKALRERGKGRDGDHHRHRECRRNLKLRTKTGSIDAKITLLCRESVEGPIRIDIGSMFGTLDIRLRTSPANPPKRPPIRLHAMTRTGTVSLQLPRSFHGFLVVRTAAGLGTCSLESELSAAVQWVEEGIRTKRYFVGNWSREEKDGKWEGDQVKIETVVGSVEVAYVDE